MLSVFLTLFFEAGQQASRFPHPVSASDPPGHVLPCPGFTQVLAIHIQALHLSSKHLTHLSNLVVFFIYIYI